MSCCQCQGIEELFSEEYVAKELKRYRKRGPDKTTRMLINALKEEDVRGLTLLDIGGGLGAIQHEMLGAGVQSAIDVEASIAYLNATKEETARRGYAEQVSYQHGNFVNLAENVAPADIVTLDRVICCYPDMQNLVSLSVARASKYYGLVFLREDWWMKIWHFLQSSFLRLTKSNYRTFLHPTKEVEKLVKNYGFKRRFYRQTFFWQVIIYTR
ncbi:MAG: methyltransferase [Anaerolineales bacterium]|jgi:magnesium-protoporphyrin O-methyltransferase